MATTKKPVSKKTTVKKTTVSKTPVKKSAPAKATSAKTTTKKAAKTGSYQSFKVSKASEPFTTFRITRQTVYWVILIAFIIFVQLWILKLQIEVASLLELQQTELLNDI